MPADESREERIRREIQGAVVRPSSTASPASATEAGDAGLGLAGQLPTATPRPLSSRQRVLLLGAGAALLAAAVAGGGYWLGRAGSDGPRAPVQGSRSAAGAKSGTGWTLWMLSQTWKGETSAGTPPSSEIELEIEKDLDRGACELVRQGKIRAAQRSAKDFISRESEDGVIYSYKSADPGSRTMRFEHFLCLAAGQRPLARHASE